METIRQITGAVDSVPHYVDSTPGTFTADGRKLSYSGPDDLRLTLDKYANVWLWFPGAGPAGENYLVEIQSYGQYSAYARQDVTVVINSGATGYIVEALLTQYQLTNVGSGAATVNGTSLGADSPLIMGIPGQSVSPVTLDPVIVDSTGSDVRVVEQR